MKSTLRFEKKTFLAAELGAESSVPDLMGTRMVQNDLAFDLDETDEIYEGYGKVRSSYPYRPFTSYSRELSEREFQTAVLENDYLCATFLPELGGRLWSLVDKNTGRNLLYTNDVIRYSNLAIRNAWFSGGVEWNIGVIGHSPLTTKPLYTAQLTKEDGTPVLRMYEYERIRSLEYQMDFWLGGNDTYLNCCMRVVNSTQDVVPMYWWSNIAVPEYEQGRVIVPAQEAFTSTGQIVHKVAVPEVDRTDISFYQNIPSQVDYFFHIPEDAPKYIANLDASGYGLLHISTNRLKSRKLFSWGNNDGSDRWQEFLTKGAGRYLEIQAGLGKTQYGCIPMAPHTAWEWMEQYGPCSFASNKGDYESMREAMTKHVTHEIYLRDLYASFRSHHKTALQNAELLQPGSLYGAIEDIRRMKLDLPRLSSHLDYVISVEDARRWKGFLDDGLLPTPDTNQIPRDFFCDNTSFLQLRRITEAPSCMNWYAYYLLGTFYIWKSHYALGTAALERSLAIAKNPWAYHALASVSLLQGKRESACTYVQKGLALRSNDLSYIIEMFQILLTCDAPQDILDQYRALDPELQKNKRLTYDYISALAYTGNVQEAYELLSNHFVLDDIRECDGSLNRLWEDITSQLFGKAKPVPHELNFASLA